VSSGEIHASGERSDLSALFEKIQDALVSRRPDGRLTHELFSEEAPVEMNAAYLEFGPRAKKSQSSPSTAFMRFSTAAKSRRVSPHLMANASLFTRIWVWSHRSLPKMIWQR
jgi:hypothetical protein